MGMRDALQVRGSGGGGLLPPGCQTPLLPSVGISHRFIRRARMGLTSPPSPPPSFPTAAVSDSHPRRARFLPGHQHRLARPALSPALRDPPAVPARMGRLVPLAVATLIPGGGDAGAAALSCCLRAEPRLQGTETLVTPGGRLTMMGRAIRTSLVARSVRTDRRRLHRWRNGRSCSWPGGSCGREAGGSAAPSPSSRSRDGRCSQNGLASWNARMGPAGCFCPHRSSLALNSSSRKMGKKGPWGESKGWRDAGKTESSRAAGWA